LPRKRHPRSPSHAGVAAVHHQVGPGHE
jgi:hypothetical protein